MVISLTLWCSLPPSQLFLALGIQLDPGGVVLLPNACVSVSKLALPCLFQMQFPHLEHEDLGPALQCHQQGLWEEGLLCHGCHMSILENGLPESLLK